MTPVVMLPQSVADVYAFVLATRIGDRGRIDRYERFIHKLGLAFVLAVYHGESMQGAGAVSASRFYGRLESALGGKEFDAQ